MPASHGVGRGASPATCPRPSQPPTTAGNKETPLLGVRGKVPSEQGVAVGGARWVFLLLYVYSGGISSGTYLHMYIRGIHIPRRSSAGAAAWNCPCMHACGCMHGCLRRASTAQLGAQDARILLAALPRATPCNIFPVAIEHIFPSTYIHCDICGVRAWSAFGSWAGADTAPSQPLTRGDGIRSLGRRWLAEVRIAGLCSQTCIRFVLFCVKKIGLAPYWHGGSTALVSAAQSSARTCKLLRAARRRSPPSVALPLSTESSRGAKLTCIQSGNSGD